MKLVISIVFASAIVFGSASIAAAQCDRNSLSPIRCGYYDEGYQDGARDAQENRDDDYRRYRNKFERQYEDHYRDGYRAGFLSVPRYGRWTVDQRRAYDLGYNYGENDRRIFSGRNPRSEAQMAAAVRPYFLQGYNDGFQAVPRRYDFQIGTDPGYPGGPGYPGYPGGPGYPGYGGTATGTVQWSGRVDHEVHVIIQGSLVRAQDISGSGYRPGMQSMNGVLPRRPANVSVRKRDGRGTVSVIQQPQRTNNYTAIVRIFDTRAGEDDYRLEISWQANIATEPYQNGQVTWRGRVDQNARIIISGNDVFTENVSGEPLSNVRHDMNGYLARAQSNVTVRKRDGRGSATVVQHPSAANDYIAVVQIFDPQSGADNYELEIIW